jgi:phosphatidylserine decarboxylase
MRKLILSPKKESKFGQNNPENRRTLIYARGLMTEIRYIDRASNSEKTEKIYGHFFLKLLYGDSHLSKWLAYCLLPFFSKIPFLSHLYGLIQNSPLSRYKIGPFIHAFHINTKEFLNSPHSFRSFNEFFTRKLKPSARPIIQGDQKAILPADARYLFFQNIDQADGFAVKGKKFSLSHLLQNQELADKYQRGAMVIARLCPVDYHRFHFPCDNTPSQAQLINGFLYSVNPIAIKKNINYLSENKRMLTTLHTKHFGEVLFIEVGATHVGSIHQTYIPNQPYAKGDEKGFFSFGGSCLILLFEPGKIIFDQDLLEASQKKIEIYALFGQSMGTSG